LEHLLNQQDLELTAVLDYELPIEKIVARLSGRRICGGCDAVYHAATQPPRAEGVCDQCGGKLYQREDDGPESVRVRMEAYGQSTRPLIDFYKRRGLLVSIAAEGSTGEIYARTLGALDDK
jgi:adenylate kinase